jgi:hypothetical protein
MGITAQPMPANMNNTSTMSDFLPGRAGFFLNDSFAALSSWQIAVTVFLLLATYDQGKFSSPESYHDVLSNFIKSHTKETRVPSPVPCSNFRSWDHSSKLFIRILRRTKDNGQVVNLAACLSSTSRYHATGHLATNLQPSDSSF